MKHLCGYFETKFYSRLVTQSVLNHSNFHISSSGQGSFLWRVFSLQSVQIFIASPLPACKCPRKVNGALKLFINIDMLGKLYATLRVSVFALAANDWSLSKMAELTNSDVLFSALATSRIPDLALYHCRDSTFAVGSNHSVAFSITKLSPIFYWGFVLGNLLQLHSTSSFA